MIKRITKFISIDLWRLDVDDLSKSKFFLIQQLRVFVLAYRGFNEDNVLLRASALTFYSLISIVPVIAMAFGIAKGFGFDEALDAQINSYFINQKQVSEMLIGFSHSFLENAKGGVIAGVGIMVLFWSVMKVLTNVELSFNAIWGITKARNWVRKFTEYLSIMLVAPIFMILSGGITAYISSVSSNVLAFGNLEHYLGPFVHFFIGLIPYFLIWLLFSFLYVAIPNTKVTFKNALIGGVIAGTAFQVLEWAYFTFQIGAVQYNAVYGSFAAFPLFLVWLQLSWMIVLFGCEIAYASQNLKQYIYENEVNTISIKHKKKISLLMVLIINKNFNAGKSPFTSNDISVTLKLPLRLVQNIINELMEMGLLIEAYTDQLKLIGYTPAKELNSLTFADLISLMEEKGSNDIPIKNSNEWNLANSTIDEFLNNNQANPLNKKLDELI